MVFALVSDVQAGEVVGRYICSGASHEPCSELPEAVEAESDVGCPTITVGAVLDLTLGA